MDTNFNMCEKNCNLSNWVDHCEVTHIFPRNQCVFSMLCSLIVVVTPLWTFYFLKWINYPTNMMTINMYIIKKTLMMDHAQGLS
jgi:hypothetical protein